MGIPFPLTLNLLQGQPELVERLPRQNYPPSACGSFPLILNLLKDERETAATKYPLFAYRRFPLILNLLKDERETAVRNSNRH